MVLKEGSSYGNIFMWKDEYIEASLAIFQAWWFIMLTQEHNLKKDAKMKLLAEKKLATNHVKNPIAHVGANI